MLILCSFKCATIFKKIYLELVYFTSSIDLFLISLNTFWTYLSGFSVKGNYLINYLANRGPELQPFVTGSLIQLLCRVTKFGWFDDDRFREVAKESMKFLSQVNIYLVKKSATRWRRSSVDFAYICNSVCMWMYMVWWWLSGPVNLRVLTVLVKFCSVCSSQ